MKPPVENVKVSTKGRETLIQSKRNTGLKQWNELLRWAFCISLAIPETPKLMRKLDIGIEPIEWTTFAGQYSNTYSAMFFLRASSDGIELSDHDAIGQYFRAHIERGIASLRSLKSLSAIVDLATKEC